MLDAPVPPDRLPPRPDVLVPLDAPAPLDDEPPPPPDAPEPPDPPDASPLPDAPAPPDARPPRLHKLDLLIEVDNSSSMETRQANLFVQLEALFDTLTETPHHIRPMYDDVRVGVISSDLGTPGSNTPGCANPALGDDGLLNPIRYGQALQNHLPWAPRQGQAAPPGFRPARCSDPNQFPSFITFCSSAAGVDCDAPETTRDLNTFVENAQCNLGLYVNGCGLEQQLEAVSRALVWHNPRSTPGNTDPNAGFVRDDAVLAIVLFTDEEDMSVRDCRFAGGAPCEDATEVYQLASARWSDPNLNLRGYLYEPCSAQDPTWPLDRYINPRDPSAGWLALKPGHPEHVFFAAITGVPRMVPRGSDGSPVDWDRLLGAPSPRDREDFCGRDARTALSAMSPEGPVSMRQANRDPSCPDRVVPACRLEGSTFDPARPACNAREQYFAWPARRITEVARRFDQSPLCDGRPCHHGTVVSICGGNYVGELIGLLEPR